MLDLTTINRLPPVASTLTGFGWELTSLIAGIAFEVIGYDVEFAIEFLTEVTQWIALELSMLAA